MSEHKSRTARYLGCEFSTSAVSVFVRDAEQGEEFLTIPMYGRTSWHGEPAFAHDYIGFLLVYVLSELTNRGWSFSGQEGVCVFAFRQHDMTLTDDDRNPLGPALSWMSNAAVREAELLSGDDRVVEEVGGKPAPRMILPKAAWLLKREQELATRIRWLLTTGDWLVAMLISERPATACIRLSTSDGLSNALLNQSDKRKAEYAIGQAGLKQEWVPEPIESGQVVGVVQPTSEDRPPWSLARTILSGWRVGATLGDNHSAAFGNSLQPGVLSLSAGSSGVASAIVDRHTSIRGNDTDPAHPAPLRFEYFDKTLLLTMLHRCTLAYDDFRNSQLGGALRDDHEMLNEMANRADITKLLWVTSDEKQEYFPDGWSDLDEPEKVASMQLSVAGSLLHYARDLLTAVVDPEPAFSQCVLTGGLSASPFFQQAILVGMRISGPCAVVVSGREGPGRYQAGARGAMMAAMLPDCGYDVDSVARNMTSVKSISEPAEERFSQLNRRLRERLD